MFHRSLLCTGHWGSWLEENTLLESTERILCPDAVALVSYFTPHSFYMLSQGHAAPIKVTCLCEMRGGDDEFVRDKPLPMLY